MHNSPRDLRLLLIDPKRVELVQYDGVPHLISPVVKEIDRAVDSLRRVIKEMDNRYKEFAAVGVRNIEGYNQSQLIVEPLPYLVVIVDELNQLMMTAAEIVEASICRLAQLSRATGIHLIVATQRPSVDVVTGLIKANVPTRIAFTVPSIMDSRTILDIGGAEKLLGMGDMLYLPSDAAVPKRLRGCFVSDHEIDRVVKFWKQPQETCDPLMEDSVAAAFASLAVDDTVDEDSLLPAARRLAKDTSHMSTSLIQRRLHVGYPRAARIMDSLEKEGLIVRGESGSPAEFIEADEEEE
jgi:S-DNA-T family DNA segregation ATPase FtsK/SpoIIIE